MRIVYYPAVKTAKTLGELLARTAWYLPDMAHATVVLPVADPMLAPAPAPEWMGTACTPSFAVEKVSIGDNPDATALLARADCVLLWDDELNIMERYNMAGVTCRIINVSKASQKMRHEAYHNAIMRGEFQSEAERRADLEDCRDRLKAAIPAMKRGRSYVFGTGPSLAEAMNHDFSDGATIICNTIIRNKALLDHIRPDCIVAADPALHFGTSRYAASFRADLVEAMETYGSRLFIPLGYYALFVRHYPHLRSQTFGVPVAPAAIDNISTDLAESYQIACYANILTMFLLPLGSTLADEVHVFGCDGRAPSGVPEDNASPFWEHHAASEYEDEYHTLHLAHPGFFMLNLQEWYDDHCHNVALLAERMEARGKGVVTRSRSFIPALAHRLTPGLRERYLPQAEAAQAEPQDSPYSYVRDTRKRSAYKATVFVSLYRAERFMAAIMENLTSQTLYRQGLMEIVLIDSNSPERERDVAARYMETLEHFLYARTHERETVYAAFNRGISEARGEYVMNLDADNRLRNDAVALFADYLDTHPDIGLVYGNQFISQIENEEFHNHVRFGFCRRAAYDPSMVLHGFYFGSEMMWRRALHDTVGLYREDLIVAGDYDMACKLAEQTAFARVDEYFGMYTKNLGGVEFSNLELCAEESRAVRRDHQGRLPKPKDPPRVHVHYPLREKGSEEYIAVVCHAMSFDKSVEPAVAKILDNLCFPHIIYLVDQNSSPTAQASMAHLIGKGMAVSGESLLPSAKALFDLPMAYSPAIRFCILAHGRVAVLEKDFMSLSRPALTGYFRAVYEELTTDLRNEAGRIDPLKVPTLCDHHEIARLDLAPHFTLEAEPAEPLDGDLAVFIQHYAPKGQEPIFREALKRCIDSVRSQNYGGRCRVIVSDDGSHWSRKLGHGLGHGIRAISGDALRAADCLSDIDADCYLYKNRTGYFSKGVLWNAAVGLTRSDKLIFLDDDHFFNNQDALATYHRLLDQWRLVVGRTASYRFMDVDGVYHVQHMGFDSPVVQGSNFGIRRATLEAAGGFDRRTFVWGTGDDPALFWKLYQQLRPTDYRREKQACYVDALETENPYSGRWQTDCRVNRELFTRDFLRLYRVHPNNNPSRQRASWMVHIPAGHSAAHSAPGTAKAPDEPAVTVVVPHLGDEWATRRTVVSIIEQRIAEPVEILVPHATGQTPGLGLLPGRARLLDCGGASPTHLARLAAGQAQGRIIGVYMPGVIMAEKTLKPVLQLLDGGDTEAVLGARVVTDAVGLERKRHYPPHPAPANAIPFLAEWSDDHPFFFRREVASEMTSDDRWGMRLLIALGERGTCQSRTNIFSYHDGEGQAPDPKEAAALIEGLYPGQRDSCIAGALRDWRSAKRVDTLTSLQNLVEWHRAFRQREADLRTLHDALSRDGIAAVALCGESRDTDRLMDVWFKGLPVAGRLTALGDDSTESGLPRLDDLGDASRFNGVVLCTPAREERDFNALRGRGVERVYAIRRRFGH